MSTISNNDIARGIYLSSKEGTSPNKIVQFLARRHLLDKAPNILLALEKIISREEGVTIARVQSVDKLDEKIKTHLAQNLKQRYSAKEVILVETLDPKLLGGLRIEMNDEVIDLSIKNRMNKLQEYLTRPA